MKIMNYRGKTILLDNKGKTIISSESKNEIELHLVKDLMGCDVSTNDDFSIKYNDSYPYNIIQIGVPKEGKIYSDFEMENAITKNVISNMSTKEVMGDLLTEVSRSDIKNDEIVIAKINNSLTTDGISVVTMLNNNRIDVTLSDGDPMNSENEVLNSFKLDKELNLINDNGEIIAPIEKWVMENEAAKHLEKVIYYPTKEEIEEVQQKGYLVLEKDDALALIQKNEEKSLRGDWEEIEEKDFYFALEVLPPKKWDMNTFADAEFFMNPEAWGSNFYDTYCKTDVGCFKAVRRSTEDYKDLMEEIKTQFPDKFTTNKIEAKEILEFNTDDNTGNVALLINNKKCANLVATGYVMKELELRDIDKTKLNEFLTELSKNEGSFLNSSIQKDGLYFDTELIAPIEDGKVNYKHEQQSVDDLAYFLNDFVAEKMQLQSLDCEQSKLINTIYNSIKLDEEVAASEFSKIEYESEVYNLLDNESKEVISDYINLKSDTIISDALNEQQKNKDLNTTNPSL